MADFKVVDGSDMLLYFNGKPLGCSTENSFSTDTEMRSAVCKESGKFNSSKPGMISASISTSGLQIYDPVVDNTKMRAWNITDIYLAQEQITWEFTTKVEGEQLLSGVGYISALELNAGDDNGTYSCTVTVDGEWTSVPVPPTV
jgi:hypothetical protein